MLENKNNLSIYCDMDGVLVNFEKQFINAMDRRYKGKKQFGQVVKGMSKKDFWKIIDDLGVPFWSEMEWMPDGRELWEYIKPHKPTILSSPSNRVVAVEGKKIWLKKNGLSGIDWIFEEDKYLYADEQHILIDDWKKNLEAWGNEGGISVLHKKTSDTIKKLNDLGIYS